eukprot:70953_1
MAGVNPAMSGMTVGGNLNAGYDVARDNLDGRCGNYPKNPKGPKKCGKIGCSNKGDFRNQYWCTHDDTWYCKEHRHNHKSGMTKCHGIGNDWVVQGVYLAKGRCDFVMQLPLKAAQLKCGQYVEFYCDHCKKWYCEKHKNDHANRNNVTKCNGINNDQVVKVEGKGDRGGYNAPSSCCIIL